MSRLSNENRRRTEGRKEDGEDGEKACVRKGRKDAGKLLGSQKSVLRRPETS